MQSCPNIKNLKIFVKHMPLHRTRFTHSRQASQLSDSILQGPLYTDSGTVAKTIQDITSITQVKERHEILIKLHTYINLLIKFFFFTS